MAEAERRQLPGTSIGLANVKGRRAKEIQVACHPGLMVGGCVPFNFCPRSVMLYVIHKQNHPDLGYRGGEIPVIHLAADFHQTVQWAANNRKRWALTPTNAGSRYSEYYSDIEDICQIRWECVETTNFGKGNPEPFAKDYKQAEFLLEDFFPWHLVERIGIHPKANAQYVANVMGASTHRPQVFREKEWYYGY